MAISEGLNWVAAKEVTLSYYEIFGKQIEHYIHIKVTYLGSSTATRPRLQMCFSRSLDRDPSNQLQAAVILNPELESFCRRQGTVCGTQSLPTSGN